jgi:hypothetical protein
MTGNNLIPFDDQELSSSSPITAVRGSDNVRKAEAEDKEMTLHETPLEVDLENGTPLSEKSGSDGPVQSSYRIRSRPVWGLKRWSGLTYIEVAILILVNVDIFVTYRTILYLWPKPPVNVLPKGIS